jgi:hypothetical protein
MTDQNTAERPAGLWQVREDTPVDDDGGREAANTYIFALDSDTVTLRLLAPHTHQWRSDDDFYRLATQWRGDTLWYLPPFGDWVELATFEDDHFVEIGSGRKRIFGRITDADVADWNRAILARRARHDYRRRADGTVDPS